MTKTKCNIPGCNKLITKGTYCCIEHKEHEKDFDEKSNEYPINKRGMKKIKGQVYRVYDSKQKLFIIKKWNGKKLTKLCHCGKSRPGFNYEGKKAMYCSECKLEGMVDVINKKCHCGKKHPSFNYEGKKAMYCSECKLEGMIDVNHKKCHCGKKQPHFNYEGKKAMYCSECKLEGMIDVNHKKCHCGKKQPGFNYEGKKAMYCSECKLEGMIDVVSKKCHCGKRQPNFNYEGKKAMYCNECKLEGMIDVNNKRCCQLDAHKFDGIPPRASCIIGADYYCLMCYIRIFPDKSIRWQVRKEQFILAEIQRRFAILAPYFLLWDCPIGACSLKRPDMLWDMMLWYLHIEIDEDGKNHEDNRKRLQRINEDMGYRPGLVIRINPDQKGNVMLRKRILSGEHVFYKTKHFDICMDKIGKLLEQYVIPFINEQGDFIENKYAISNTPKVIKIFFD